MSSSSFRTTKWDPLLIIAQIAALQSLCYILYSIILSVALTLNGSDFSLDFVFSNTEIRIDTGFGWLLIIVWVVNAFLSIPILMFIVQRAKQILDFVATFHLFHLLFVWRNSYHFPTNVAWWILQITDIAIMTFGGEWACMHREMKPILISSGLKSNNRQNASTSNQTEQIEDQEEHWNKHKKRETLETKGDQGALSAAVDKAKRAILSGTGTGGKTKRGGKHKYEQISMADLDMGEQSSHNT